jgi:chromosome segregation ATPase
MDQEELTGRYHAPAYNGDGPIPDEAPGWLREAMHELRAEREQSFSAINAALKEIRDRDERMMAMLEKVLNRAVSNESRLQKLENQVEENAVAISHLQIEIKKMPKP